MNSVRMFDMWKKCPLVNIAELNVTLAMYTNTAEWKASMADILCLYFSLDEQWPFCINLMTNPEEGIFRRFGFFLMRMTIKNKWSNIVPGSREEIKEALIKISDDAAIMGNYSGKCVECLAAVAVEIVRKDPSFLRSRFFTKALDKIKTHEYCDSGIAVLNAYLKGLHYPPKGLFPEEIERLTGLGIPLLPDIVKVIKSCLEPVIILEKETYECNYKKTTLEPKHMFKFDYTNLEEVEAICKTTLKLLEFLKILFAWAPANCLDPGLIRILQGWTNILFNKIENRLPLWETKKKFIFPAFDCLTFLLTVPSSVEVDLQLINGTFEIFKKLDVYFIKEAEPGSFDDIFKEKVLKCVEMVVTHRCYALEHHFPVQDLLEFIDYLDKFTLHFLRKNKYQLCLNLWASFFENMFKDKNQGMVKEIYGDTMKKFVSSIYQSVQFKYNKVNMEGMLCHVNYEEAKKKWFPIQKKSLRIIELAAAVQVSGILLPVLEDFQSATEFILKTPLNVDPLSHIFVFEFTDMFSEEYLMNLGDAITLITLFDYCIAVYDRIESDVFWTEEIYNKFNSFVLLAEYFVHWKLVYSEHVTFKLFKVYALKAEIMLLEILIKSLPWLSEFDNKFPDLKNIHRYAVRLANVAKRTVTDPGLPDRIIELAETLLENLCCHCDLSKDVDLFNDLNKLFCNNDLLQLPFEKQLFYMRILQGYAILTKKYKNSPLEYAQLIAFITNSVHYLRNGIFETLTDYCCWNMRILLGQIEYAKDLTKDEKKFVAESLNPLFKVCTSLINMELEPKALILVLNTIDIIFKVFGKMISPELYKDMGKAFLRRFDREKLFSYLMVTEDGRDLLTSLMNCFTGMVDTVWVKEQLKDITDLSYVSLNHFAGKQGHLKLKKALVDLHGELLFNYPNWFYGADHDEYFIDILWCFRNILEIDEDPDVLGAVVNSFVKMSRKCKLFPTIIFERNHYHDILYAMLDILHKEKVPDAEFACYEVLYGLRNLNPEMFNPPMISSFDTLHPMNDKVQLALSKYHKADDLTTFCVNYRKMFSEYKIYKHLMTGETNPAFIVEMFVKEWESEKC